MWVWAELSLGSGQFFFFFNSTACLWPNSTLCWLNSSQLTFTAYTYSMNQEYMCMSGCWFWPLSGVFAFQCTVVIRVVWGGTPFWPDICIHGSTIAYRTAAVFCFKPHKIQCLIFPRFSDMVLPVTWWQYCFKSVKLLRNTSSAFTTFHLYRKYLMSQKSQKNVFQSITVGP